MSKSKYLTQVAITVVIVIIIVLSYSIYLWKEITKTQIPVQQVVENVKPVPQPQVEEEKESQPLDKCGKIDSSLALFSDSTTSLSFCYKASWGTPEVKESTTSPESKIGTVYYISFTKIVNKNRVYDSPLINYSTLDFELTGDRDGSPFMGWSEIDFDDNEAELVKLFPNQNAVVQKLIVNNRQALKVKSDFIHPLSEERITPLDYFMPNVVINGTAYNLHIIGSSEQETDLDKLLESMTF